MIKKSRKWFISAIKQDEFAENEFLINIFNGNLRFAILFANDFDSYDIIEDLCCQINYKINEIYSNYDYYYSILLKYKILLVFVHHIPLEMSQNFYFFEIKEMFKDRERQNNLSPKEKEKSKEIIKILNEVEQEFKNAEDEVSVNDGLDTLINLLKIKESEFAHSIFHSLQPSITKYIKLISANKKKFKMTQIEPLDILSIYPDISEEELSAYVEDLSNFSDGEKFKILMNLFFLLHNDNFYKKLQAILSSFDLGSYLQSRLKDFILISKPIYKQSEYLIFYLLSNQSLSSHEHFVDIIWKKKIKYFITHFLDIDEKNNFLSQPYFENLYPFLFVACFNQLYPQKNTFHAVVQNIFPKNGNKYSQASDFIKDKIIKIKDLIQRVDNDNELVYNISQYLGRKVTLETLVTESVPYLFKDRIPFCDDLLFSMIFHTKSFLLSEYDMNNAESFLYAPKIYISIINFVIGKEKEIPPDLKDNNVHFKIDEIRRKIFIDIFSLIFLQKSDNQFFCDIDKADSILQFLISFNINGMMTKEEQDLIKNSRQHISFSQLYKKTDLNSAIFSYNNYLRDLITSGDEKEFHTAKALVPTLGSPKLKTIMQILTFMKDSKDQTKLDDQYKYCFAVEWSFSHNKITYKSKEREEYNEKKFEEEEEEEDEDEELKEKEKTFMGWFNNNHLIESQKYFSEYILSLIYNLDELHSIYKRPLDFLSKKGNLIHTLTWKAYMSLYAKFEQAVKNDKNNHYDPNRKLEPSEIVQILHKGEVDASMSNLDTLLGIHALEFLLLYTPEFNEKIYKLVDSKSSITAQAIRYEFALKGDYKNSNEDNVYEHFLEKKAGYGDDEFEIISNDFDTLVDSHDTSLSSLTKTEINDLIDKYVNVKPLPIKYLNELYLRAPTIYLQKMKEFIQNDLKRFTINQLLELYPFCGMKSLPFLKRMNIDIIDEHDIANLLIKKTRWTTFRLFLEDIKYLFDLDNKEEDNEVEKRFINYIYTFIKNNPKAIHIIPKDFLDKIDIDQFIDSSPQQDYETCYVIETISDLNYYLSRTDEDFDVTETIDMINRLLQPLVIDNNFREYVQRQIHKLSFNFSKRFKHSFATKLRALSSMLYRDLLGRYGIIISLSNFSTETFGSHVAKICLKYDFFKECQEICAAWSLDLSLYKAKIALSAFKIGLVNEGMNFISPPIRNDQLVDQIVDILSNEFIFDYSQIIDASNDIENVQNYIVNIKPDKRWISNIILNHSEIAQIDDENVDHSEIKQIGASLVAESPQTKALHKLLLDLNSIDKLIMFYASKGYFEYAFDTWNTIKRRNTKSELFIRSIVFPSLIFQNWISLWMKVRKMEDQEQINPYVNDLFKFLHQKKMGYTAYNIQMSLHLYSLAFKTACDYFGEMKSWEGLIRIIDSIKKASKKDKGVSKEILAKIDFEENYIVKPCIENNIPFNNSLNIMTTKKNALNTAVYLTKKGEADVVMLKLLPMTLFTLNDMCHALLDDVMMSSENGAMHKLFLAIEKANLQNYEVIVFNLFQAIDNRVADKGSLSQFIDENVRDYLKGQVFITFGFLDRAYDCAVKTHDKYLMELVRDNAEKQNNNELYKKALDYLKK